MQHRSTGGVIHACAFSVVFAASLAIAALSPAGALAAGNAGYTTFDPVVGGCVHNSEINCNIYESKEDVYINGGPSGGKGLAAGEYFFAVLAPGCQNGGFLDGANGNLSDTTPGTGETGCSDEGTGSGDTVENRTFTVSNGVISAYSGTHATGTAMNGDKIIALFSYDDTPNPGGVYTVAICPVGTTTPASCKFDAFKVKSTGTQAEGTNLVVTKDAEPEFTREFNWTIEKKLGECQVTVANPNGCQVSTSEKKLNYEVIVTKNGGSDSGWQVKGKIKVFNPNESEATEVEVADAVNAGASCEIEGAASPDVIGGLGAGETKEVSYVCTFASKPEYNIDYTNTATVTWNAASVGTTESSESFSVHFQFLSPTKLVHDSISLVDAYEVIPTPAGSATLEGELPSGEVNSSQTFKYAYLVKVPHGCLKLNNTASFTVADADSDSNDAGSSAIKAEVCRTPAVTGALTMGFWQNKNGQGIISAANQGNLGTWLRQFHPFSDAPASKLAEYVSGIIKAASCTSTSKTCNTMLRAQMLATALDVYFSTPALGGNKIGAYNGLGPKQPEIGSIKIDLTQICQMIDGSGGSATCSGTYENASSAFGGATSMTVLEMLVYQNTSDPAADAGAKWYGQVKATQVLAKDAFDAINNGVAFSS